MVNSVNSNLTLEIDNTSISAHEQERARVTLLSPSERSDFVESIVIPIPQFTQAIKMMDTLYDKHEQKEPGGLKIYGASGSGKSIIGKFFLQKHPPIFSENAEIPVLHITLTSTINITELLPLFFKAIGYPFTITAGIHSQIELLVTALKERQVRLIIIDEAQELAERKASTRTRRLSNILKNIYTKSNIPQVYLGTNILKYLFEIGEQLATRITTTHSISSLSLNMDYISMLNAFDDSLPMHSPCNLAKNYAENLLDASGGILRILRMILSNAVRIAAEDHSESITRKHFSNAYFEVLGSGENPFNV